MRRAAITISIILSTGCSPLHSVQGGKDSASQGADAAPDTPGANPTPPPTPTLPIPSPTVPHGDPFVHPWSRSDSVIVIDAYQGNALDWNKMATDPKLAGIFHRSSMGLTKDTLYGSRKAEALARGYLWGAYHLGTSADPIAQAKFFLDTVGAGQETLWALDLEDTSSSSMMNVNGAVKFMDYVYQRTGRVPVIYANHNVVQALNSSIKSGLILKSKLWYARFKDKVSDFPVGIWPGYFIWQFSSEINCTTTGRCLYNVPGTQFDMDVNVFNGTRDELASKWHNDEN